MPRSLSLSPSSLSSSSAIAPSVSSSPVEHQVPISHDSLHTRSASIAGSARLSAAASFGRDDTAQAGTAMDGQGHSDRGLGGSDVSNMVWLGSCGSVRAGPVRGFPRPSSSPSISVRPPLPTINPIPIPPSPPSKRSAAAARNNLRLSPSPSAVSPVSPILRPRPPLLSRIARATLPRRFLSAECADADDRRPFEYPKSPSLLRDPPTKRHGRRLSILPTSPRKGAILFLALVLSVLWYVTAGEERRLLRLRSWRAQEAEEGQRGWRAAPGAPAVGAPEGAVHIDYWGKVDYGVMLDGLRGKDVMVKEKEGAKGEKPPVPLRADVVVPPKEQEAADLTSIVSVASLELAQKEQEAKDNLAMARIVKPAAPGTDNLEAKAAKAAVAAAAAKALDPKKKKDPSRYKRLMPLGAPSRRYLYGANFVLSPAEAAADKDGDATEEVDDPELTNVKVKVPSQKKLQKMFAAGKKQYEEGMEGWRSFEWHAPAAHSSLERFVSKLEPDELALRSWIRRLHLQPKSSGVGLGSTSPSSPFLPAKADLSLVIDAPSFDRGSLDKYAELLVQAENGHAGKCAGATWLDKYQKMHAEMLAGKREPKFISYSCEQGINCGGLGDRLLGMTSAFFFGLVTNRAFLAEWQSPIPLDLVFDSPHVNWSYSSYTSHSHPVLGKPKLAEQAAELDIIHFDRLSVDATFGSASWNAKRDGRLTKGFEKRDLAYASPWIKFFTNRGMIYRSFKYKHLQKSIARLGLQPTTAFSCISQYLFQPKPPAMDLIAQYTSVLALPSVFSVGLHIRTGDLSMKDLEYDKINTVKRHTQFFRCAREFSETYAQRDQKVVFYLVTDSAHLKEDAQRVYGDKLVTTDIVPQHVHQKSGHADGVFSAVVEDWILAKTDMLVATQDSGFGKLAAFMHAKEKSTVTIFPRYNPDVLGLQSKKSHIKVDCTSPDVFTTFDELSSEWSLG
ncbi:hypothetical protein JCM11641_003958 [Rhodosporidiobolus odoratus]